MQNYYAPQNLERLKAIDPDLHYQLEHMSFRIHDSWQLLSSNPDMPVKDAFLIDVYKRQDLRRSYPDHRNIQDSPAPSGLSCS